MPALTDFQLKVNRLFFGLPASRGFLLAGGAALLAQHLTTRPTEDLDFFTAPNRGHVPAARDALEAAARERGWAEKLIRGTPSAQPHLNSSTALTRCRAARAASTDHGGASAVSRRAF